MCGCHCHCHCCSCSCRKHYCPPKYPTTWTINTPAFQPQGLSGTASPNQSPPYPYGGNTFTVQC